MTPANGKQINNMAHLYDLRNCYCLDGWAQKALGVVLSPTRVASSAIHEMGDTTKTVASEMGKTTRDGITVVASEMGKTTRDGITVVATEMGKTTRYVVEGGVRIAEANSERKSHNERKSRNGGKSRKEKKGPVESESESDSGTGSD